MYIPYIMAKCNQQILCTVYIIKHIYIYMINSCIFMYHVSIKQTLSFQSRCSCISMYFGQFFFHIIITLRTQVTSVSAKTAGRNGTHPSSLTWWLLWNHHVCRKRYIFKWLFFSMVMLVFQGVVPLWLRLLKNQNEDNEDIWLIWPNGCG